MSAEDYATAYESVINRETYDEENRQYYDDYSNEYKVPEGNTDLEIKEVETMSDEKAMEVPGFEPPMQRQVKLQSLPPQRNIFKEVAEPESIYKTRIYFINILDKIRISLNNQNIPLHTDSIDIFSRMLTNRYWYKTVYTENVEKYLDILEEYIKYYK